MVQRRCARLVTRPLFIASLTVALMFTLLSALLPVFGSLPVVAQGEGSGLIDGTSYESPQFGYTLTWDDAWSARERDVTSNDGGFDTITIRHDSGTVRVSGRADDYPAIDFLNDTVDLIAANADASETVRESLDGDVPSVEMTADRDHLIVEAHALPESGAVVVLTLRAREGVFATALAAARESITLDDEPVMQGGESGSPTVVADDTDDATPDTATPGATNEGIDGESYTSPTYGYRLTWDGNIWEAESRVGDDGYNELRLESPSATLAIWSGPFYEGDPAACLKGESGFFETEDPAITDWQPAEDADGEPIAGETANASYGVFNLTYSDPENEDAEPVELIDYIECRALVEGETVLVIFATTTPERYNDTIDDVLRITNAIDPAGDEGASGDGTPAPATPAIDVTPDASPPATPAGTPAASPAPATPAAAVPSTPVPATPLATPVATPLGTPGGTPAGPPSPVVEVTGLDGSTFTSPGFGFSIEIPSTWSVDNEFIAREYEKLVLTNGTSVVTLQATREYSGDPEGCVAFAYEQIADLPAFTDLAPDVTGSGEPFEGSNSDAAYASYTYTGADDETYAHFVSCRAIAEGESYLILTQDVPYDAYATQRQARRQIEDAIVFP